MREFWTRYEEDIKDWFCLLLVGAALAVFCVFALCVGIFLFKLLEVFMSYYLTLMDWIFK